MFCQGTGQLLGRARIDYLFRDVFAKSLNAKVWGWGGAEATILEPLREIPQDVAHVCQFFATKWMILPSYIYHFQSVFSLPPNSPHWTTAPI